MNTPEAYRILMSKRTASNLQTIFDHIAKDSPENAAGMVERILQAIEGLKLFPHHGIITGQSLRVKHPVRSIAVPPYLVFSG